MASISLHEQDYKPSETKEKQAETLGRGVFSFLTQVKSVL